MKILAELFHFYVTKNKRYKVRGKFQDKLINSLCCHFNQNKGEITVISR